MTASRTNIVEWTEGDLVIKTMGSIAFAMLVVKGRNIYMQHLYLYMVIGIYSGPNKCGNLYHMLKVMMII